MEKVCHTERYLQLSLCQVWDTKAGFTRSIPGRNLMACIPIQHNFGTVEAGLAALWAVPSCTFTQPFKLLQTQKKTGNFPTGLFKTVQVHPYRIRGVWLQGGKNYIAHILIRFSKLSMDAQKNHGMLWCRLQSLLSIRGACRTRGTFYKWCSDILLRNLSGGIWGGQLWGLWPPSFACKGGTVQAETFFNHIHIL